jgi:hypothetical protein
LALRAYRVDGNQKAIVAALREEGFIVQHLHKVGEGCPDLLIGHSHNGRRYNVLLEIKDGDGKLTAQQVIWHAGWRGQVAVVNNAKDAIIAVYDACK